MTARPRAAVMPCLCHRMCNGQVRTGRAGQVGTQSGDRALSGVTCGLYGENREFEKRPGEFFKTSNDLGAKDLRLSWLASPASSELPDTSLCLDS